MKRTLFVLILVTLGIGVACNSEREVIVDDLMGTWEVMAAERNGRDTETLNGAIFDFRANGTMLTNISGQEDVGEFAFENMRIHHQGAMEAEYQIDAFAADSMQLEVRLHDMHFALKLNRTEAE